MTGQEIIQYLQQRFNEEELETLDVHFAYNYGDYWKTTVAPDVNSIEVGYVRKDRRLGMDEQLFDDDEKEFIPEREFEFVQNDLETDPEKKIRKVIILS